MPSLKVGLLPSVIAELVEQISAESFYVHIKLSHAFSIYLGWSITTNKLLKWLGPACWNYSFLPLV